MYSIGLLERRARFGLCLRVLVLVVLVSCTRPGLHLGEGKPDRQSSVEKEDNSDRWIKGRLHDPGGLVRRDSLPLPVKLVFHRRKALSSLAAIEEIAEGVADAEGRFRLPMPEQRIPPLGSEVIIDYDGGRWVDRQSVKGRIVREVPIQVVAKRTELDPPLQFPTEAPFWTWEMMDHFSALTIWMRRGGEWLLVGSPDPRLGWEREFPIELASAEVRVLVRDWSSGAPVPEATVRLALEEGGPVPGFRAHITSEEGRVVFPVRAAREDVGFPWFALDVEAPGYVPRRYDGSWYHFRQEAGELGEQWIEVELAPGRAVEGRITDEKGMHVGNSWSLFQYDLGLHSNTYPSGWWFLDVDPEGRFRCMVPKEIPKESLEQFPDDDELGARVAIGAPGFRAVTINLMEAEASFHVQLERLDGGG